MIYGIFDATGRRRLPNNEFRTPKAAKKEFLQSVDASPLRPEEFPFVVRCLTSMRCVRILTTQDQLDDMERK